MIDWIVAPLVGCAIGWLTNWIAIRMLFRPHRALYVCGRRVPLTPGLIPRERERLAHAVGGAVAEKLLNPQTLEEALLNEDMLGRVDAALTDFFEYLQREPRTLRALLQAWLGEERLAHTAEALVEQASDGIARRLIEADLGEMAANAILAHIKQKTPAALSGLVSGALDGRIRQGVAGALREGVNAYVETHAPGALRDTLARQLDAALEARVCDLARRHNRHFPVLRAEAHNAYRAVVRSSLARALETIDLAGVVRARVESFDAAELEKAVLEVAGRELGAIVWLGAALGFLMGFVNLIF